MSAERKMTRTGHELVETRQAKEAMALADVIMAAGDSAIGELVGETGTGKTAAARLIADRYQGVRVAAFEGMGRYALLQALVAVAGVDGPYAKWIPGLGEAAEQRIQRGRGARPLVIIDEANKLRWEALEMARYLCDELGWAVLLVGTELYERKFLDARTRPLLMQLGSRIGAKRVRMTTLDKADTYIYVMRPAFGEVAADLINRFWQGCRKGNWREALELAGACRRIMATNEVGVLTQPVLESALSWAANKLQG